MSLPTNSLARSEARATNHVPKIQRVIRNARSARRDVLLIGSLFPGVLFICFMTELSLASSALKETKKIEQTDILNSQP